MTSAGHAQLLHIEFELFCLTQLDATLKLLHVAKTGDGRLFVAILQKWVSGSLDQEGLETLTRWSTELTGLLFMCLVTWHVTPPIT